MYVYINMNFTFQHVYNILAFKFKFALLCNYVFMYVSIIMLYCIVYIWFFRGHMMADERKLNGSPSLNK